MTTRSRAASSPSTRHRVLFLVPDLQIGGAEKQVVDLVNHVDAARFEPTLFTFGETDDLAVKVRGDRVRRVNVPRRSRFDTAPVARLARLLVEDRIDLVHCTVQISLLFAMAAMLRARRRLPVVDAIHSTRNTTTREDVADRLLYLPLMRRCSSVIMVCDAQRRTWAGKFPSIAPRMTTVYNGVDVAHYRDDVGAEEKAELRRSVGVADGELVLGLVAAVRPEKRHDRVLEAMARLVAGGHKVKMLFVGGAPVDPRDGDALKRRTAELGLDAHVRWLGMLPEPKRMISILDAVVLFSDHEALPLALIECLAMGKPIVSSGVGGIPEIVEDGANGLLVPPGDLDAFVAALARLATDRALLARLAARARPSVEARFSVESMARATEEVMLRALSGPPAPR